VRARARIGNGGLAERRGPDDSGPSTRTARGHLGKLWRTAAARLQECGSSSSRPKKGCSSEEYSEGFYERISASIVTRQASQWSSSEGGESPEPDGQSWATTRLITLSLSGGGQKRLGSQDKPGPKLLGCQLKQTWSFAAKKAREAGQQTAPAWGTEGL
jgi:hypothetical protein